MENGPFTDDVPIKTSIYNGFSIAMLNNQMVIWPCKLVALNSHIKIPAGIYIYDNIYDIWIIW
jgi:hypothetical protein